MYNEHSCCRNLKKIIRKKEGKKGLKKIRERKLLTKKFKS